LDFFKFAQKFKMIRESDYGLVTREFEGVVDELIVAAVAAAAAAAAAPVQVPAPTDSTTAATHTPSMDGTPTDLPAVGGVVASLASPAVEALVEHPPVEPPSQAVSSRTTTAAAITATSEMETETETGTTPMSIPTIEAESTKKVPPPAATEPDEVKTEKKTVATTTPKKKL
jgi:hypothetical protein